MCSTCKTRDIEVLRQQGFPQQTENNMESKYRESSETLESASTAYF